MSRLQKLQEEYGSVDCRDLCSRQLEQFRNGLKGIAPDEVSSAEEGKSYIELLKKFREAIAENDKLHGSNYLERINSILRVGGLYSNSLHFLFDLIQNIDDCDLTMTANLICVLILTNKRSS